MLPPTRMVKYLYKSSAFALRGSIRKPYFQELEDHLAVSTYAGSAGRIEMKSDGFSIGEEVHYDSATTMMHAFEKDGVFTTNLTAQVLGLQVARRLTADEVTCCMQSVYDSRQYPKQCYPVISPAGSTIKNLRIDGQVQKLDFPPGFDGERRGEPGYFPEPIYVKGFGTVFYCEWTWVHPQEKHRQRLTMLRLALGSDTGAAICIGGGSSDGVGWPPTAS